MAAQKVAEGNASRLANKRILVTGGAGFLGSHLVDRLLALNCHVTVLDSMMTGHVSNLDEAFVSNRLTITEADVISPIKADVDVIFNLACPASPVHYQADPVHTMKTSVLGALNVLELARQTGASFMQASTSEVYGDPLQHPQTESYWGHVNPIGTRSCYDEGKRCAETLCFDYRRRHDVDAKVVRIFNTYGPRMRPDDGRVVSNFIVQALRGEPLTIYGNGEQTRSFCYVDDLIAGFIAMMEQDRDVAGPINLGNPGEFTMLQLAELVLELTGSPSRLEFLPLPQDDPQQRRPDIALAQQQLGWSPKVALREGLTATISYFKSAIS